MAFPMPSRRQRRGKCRVHSAYYCTQNARNQSYYIANVAVTYSYVIITVSARRQRAARCARHAEDRHGCTETRLRVDSKPLEMDLTQTTTENLLHRIGTLEGRRNFPSGL